MNREIKFRVWDNYAKRFICNEPSFITNDGKLGYFSGSPYYFHQDDRLKGLVIQEFTGFYDKTGREIYEGDIVETPRTKERGEVIWGNFSQDMYYPVGWNISTADETNADFHEGLCKVIGNIFENSELLTQTN